MNSLEQRRATHAGRHATGLQQRDVAKLPALIINNGLLATAAFALGEKRGPMKVAMDALAGHLAGRGLIAMIESDNGKMVTPDTKEMIDDLAARPDALSLQRATIEALAYLGYLKRFATPNE
ncbi:MAG: type III-B CRISPR module-associated protein Cmr5 [Verrucomicrobia bacterium]|nr:type III-B CRISPR module-associated protein Cmr5 [Verrucomicrobiota bacterium]